MRASSSPWQTQGKACAPAAAEEADASAGAMPPLDVTARPCCCFSFILFLRSESGSSSSSSDSLPERDIMALAPALSLAAALCMAVLLSVCVAMSLLHGERAASAALPAASPAAAASVGLLPATMASPAA